HATVIALLLAVGTMHAQPATQHLDEASFLAVGGIEQWVTIRGDDRRNPVLLLLRRPRGRPVAVRLDLRTLRERLRPRAMGPARRGTDVREERRGRRDAREAHRRRNRPRRTVA